MSTKTTVEHRDDQPFDWATGCPPPSSFFPFPASLTDLLDGDAHLTPAARALRVSMVETMCSAEPAALSCMYAMEECGNIVALNLVSGAGLPPPNGKLVTALSVDEWRNMRMQEVDDPPKVYRYRAEPLDVTDILADDSLPDWIRNNKIRSRVVDRRDVVRVLFRAESAECVALVYDPEGSMSESEYQDMKRTWTVIQ